jgi:hypothetical protein
MTEDSQVCKAFPANNNNSICENILFHKTMFKKPISVAVEKMQRRQPRKKKLEK